MNNIGEVKTENLYRNKIKRNRKSKAISRFGRVLVALMNPYESS